MARVFRRFRKAPKQGSSCNERECCGVVFHVGVSCFPAVGIKLDVMYSCDGDKIRESHVSPQ